MEVKDIDKYRLTSLKEPTDEMLSQIMREAAEEARIKGEKVREKFFEQIRMAVLS